ncbi:integrase [Streptomyces anulatus]|uniref:integrase n=1 Tax=Streptomyces anulatus TaxID=1892 RepID=UPI00386E4162
MTGIALAAVDDPFILPTPLPGDLAVLPRWISAANTHPNSRFRDEVWSLGPLTDQPGASIQRIHWWNCPAPLRDELKVLGWVLINAERRPTVVHQRGRSTRHGVIGLIKRFTEWTRFARWLHEQGVSRLSDITEDHWRAYAGKLRSAGVARKTVEYYLSFLSDLWEFDQLIVTSVGVTQPPWDFEGVDDYLPEEGESRGGENTIEPLAPSVVAPLLIWSIRLVQDLAEDILAAWDERMRILADAQSNKTSPKGRASLHAYLKRLIADRAPVPVATLRGRTTLARSYLADLTGANLRQVHWAGIKYGLPELASERPGPCPMAVPLTGLIEGQPWRHNIDFSEAEVLRRHLGTAAVIIILYLTGMRPQEVQGLRSGCCPEPEKTAAGTTRHLVYSETTDAPDETDEVDPDEESAPHLITSHHYKTVVNDDGHHVSAGEIRILPWVAIPPVVQAIRVLERFVPPGELLLSSIHHDRRSRSPQGALTRPALTVRIKDFVAWVNQEAADKGLPGQKVPEDAYGPINLVRWRRTLAWHIARRPGGLVALGLQYGHMRDYLDARTSSAYGARGRRGMHGVLDVETVLATASAAAKLRDAAGEQKISGAAAQRALVDAADMPQFAGALTTPHAARLLNRRKGHLIFDNPDALLLCAFKAPTALCDPEPGAIAPRAFACDTGCGNAVRTDEYAAEARARAEDQERQAALVPDRLAKNLRKAAAIWRGIADTHDATARTATEILP